MKKLFIPCLVVLLWGLLGISNINAQCNPSCVQTTNLNFSTGWDELAGAVISAGQIDPHWRLMNIPPVTGTLPASVATPTAYAINPINTTWNVIPGSMPLSMANQAAFGPNNANPTQPWRFRRYFCVCQDTEVLLSGRIKADDTGSLTLYDGSGSPMPFSVALPAAPNTNNFNVGVPFNQALFLPAGNYYFEFSLFNTNAVASGFAVQGTMTSVSSLSLYDEQLGCCAVSVITGQKILDNDCNQQFDPTVDQVGVGFVFDLIDNSTGNVVSTTQSDAFGEFEFNNLPPGSYTVRERQQIGWLGSPLSIQVTLGALDVQTVTFFNCPFTPTVWAGCVYGDVTANPTNIRDEKGLALAYDGGFFGSNNTHTFCSTNVPLGLQGDQQIVAKQWDNATGALQPNATLSDFTDVDPGAQTIENFHVIRTAMPCSGGTFAAVGTTNSGNNKDVFYAEYSTNGVMLSYADVTSTPGLNRESVHELISLTNNDLMWIGTQIPAPPPAPVSQVIVSVLTSCPSNISHQTFQFTDATGPVAATGRSVLELDTPLPGHPNARYALTGAKGNKAYLLLLDAALVPTFAICYDIDGDPGTREETVRIRRDGDDLFLIGNSRSVSLTASPNERIFLLKLGFASPTPIPLILVNKLYNLSGGGEKVVDAEINFNGDLILTGVSALPTSITSSADPELQKTFLMGLDPFGNQLWLNQVLLQEGSEPADLQLQPIIDQINIIGSCWTNETVTTDIGTIINVRKFDEMFLQATPFGELTINTGCLGSLEASVVNPTAVLSDFIPTATTPAFDFIAGSLYHDDYFVRPEFCFNGQGGGDVICDSLQITATSIPNPDGLCCYELDYVNNSPGPVYELCIKAISSVTFSNIAVDPALTYTLNAAGDEIRIRSASGPALPFGQLPAAIQYCVAGAGNFFAVNYFWKDISGNIVCEDLGEIACSNFECDFTWEADCCEVQFFASTTGTSTYIYEWDILCDNPASPELTGQNPSWTFPGTGTYPVCLSVIDAATGAVCTVQKQVTVTDNPPTLTCPPDITISTDPGLCTATLPLVDPMATDDCTTMFVFGCTMSGATTGPAISPVTLNKGITTITCATEDSKGQLATCTYNITVEDQEPPVITCPAPIVTSVAACDGGANVTFLPPTFADNCPMVTYVCSHQSGDFFPCGTTMVTCTATDMAGNQTTCSFPVTVNCECAEVDSGEIECTDVDDQFAFSFTVIDLTGAGPGACTINAISTQAGVTISNVTITGTGPAYTVGGLATISPPPVPNTISITINVSCVCPDGAVHDCSFTRTLATPCCKEISVDPQEVCKTGGTVQIPLLGCNTLYDVQQVRWYIADAPCPPSSWTLIQVSNGCADLNLSPIYHNGDVCVYAEVDMGPDAGPCTMLTSNIATITLCEPVSCNLSSDQAYCWVGSAITPAPLTVNLSTTACLDNIRWFDPQGNPIPAADGQLTYQPPALSFTLANTECSQSYTYRVEVSNECGTQSCSATIRLDNEDAPVGTLTLLPPDTNPLCYGEDVILEYEPECAGTPERWDWFLRLDAVPTYTPLTANGDRNPLYYSNRLYADTWVKVEKTNGVCPTDEIEILLEVIDPITINAFTAQYDDVCTPTAVDLSVDFDPNPADPGCTYTVTWYRNGQVIHTMSGVTSAPVNYTYNGLPLSGNYYCVVESTCCPGAVRSQVVTLDKPMEVYVAGPCFRCNCDTITLNGIVLNPLSGFNCTYQWYDNGVAIPGETGIDLVVDFTWDGPFTFEVTCVNGGTTCVKVDTFNLLQCGDREPCTVSVDEEFRLPARIFPNPTEGIIQVELTEADHLPRLELFDLQGKLLLQKTYSSAQSRYQLDIRSLPAGVYILRSFSQEGKILIEQVIKQ
ncbi:HYR domain-containing protein [Lewinella sp. LCG006]|uniref:HYR domain-containing protein n=1 Tax=Lewinella sp. LCG006 TaxID=3231911 RepID=UPI00345F3F33